MAKNKFQDFGNGLDMKKNKKGNFIFKDPNSGEKTKVNPNNPMGMIKFQNLLNQQNIKQQQQNNNINTTNTYGTETYTTNADGSVSRDQTLNPAEQAKLDQDRARDTQLGDLAGALTGKVNQNFSKDYSYNGMNNNPNDWNFGNAQGIANDYAGKVNNSFESLNGQRFNQESDKLKSDLLNSGLSMDSDQYKQQFQNLQDRQGRERLGMQTQALDTGMNWAGQSFGMGQQARANSINEYNQQRYAPMQELSSALGVRGGVNNPQWEGRSQVSPQNVNAQGIQDSQFANQLAQDQFDWQKSQPRGGYSGGGGTPAPSYTPYNWSNNAPKQPSPWESAGWNFLGSVGQGVGSGVGSWVSNLFK